MGQAYPIDCKDLMIKEEALIAELGGEVRKETAGVELKMGPQGIIQGKVVLVKTKQKTKKGADSFAFGRRRCLEGRQEWEILRGCDQCRDLGFGRVPRICRPYRSLHWFWSRQHATEDQSG
jgi:hypothetical protein